MATKYNNTHVGAKTVDSVEETSEDIDELSEDQYGNVETPSEPIELSSDDGHPENDYGELFNWSPSSDTELNAEI
ncbi:hypothetical protein PHLCEN_2v5112, partial [Hermanssonia centrifuga]